MKCKKKKIITIKGSNEQEGVAMMVAQLRAIYRTKKNSEIKETIND
jgi:hypothetical protein